MRARPLTVVAVLVGALASHLAGFGPASAEVLPPGSGLAGGSIGPGGDPTAFAVEAGQPGDAGGGTAGGATADEPMPCTFVTIGRDEAFAVYKTDGRELEDGVERWTVRRCNGPNGSLSISLDPQTDQVDPAVLAVQAVQSVSIPDLTISTSPAPGSLIVRVPTWLWIDAAWWQAYSATATAGDVSATVTATPTSATWSTGDGATVTCPGPGTAWALGMPDDATDCSHAYTSSSELESGGMFPLSVTVELAVTWMSNIGATGSLPALSRTTSTQVRVGEIQAIETR